MVGREQADAPAFETRLAHSEDVQGDSAPGRPAAAAEVLPS